MLNVKVNVIIFATVPLQNSSSEVLAVICTKMLPH